MSQLFKQHNLVATTDLDSARDEVARVFCPHILLPTHQKSKIDVVHNGHRFGNVGLNYIRYGDEITITPGQLSDFYLVQIPLAGKAVVKAGNHTVFADRHVASIASPDDYVDMVWSDGCEKLIVYLDRQAVETSAAALDRDVERTPVRFNPEMQLDSPAIRSWLRLIRFLSDEIEENGVLLDSPLMSAHIEDTVISGLLASQESNVVAGHERWVGNRAIRRVVDLMTDQPEHPWRLLDLAEAAGLSVRSLQDGFQRDLGQSPLEFLRSIRLDRARSELFASAPGSQTVATIAFKWGFTHLGRFASMYRLRFFESPSQTLAA
ncbi:AraC family transcriptional regulator [Alpinimonas psychrophila]|uniref:AraC-like DNA-binding protein n=1 Tax=Alpinimonas psychrophila TaxID=748908 RepID=A0A7W3JV18_9MICO|nr:AraC family transcriptional regulator [Alpinimonas psychrophila]MBA8829657.1 AraC-like DNA-binding protein [Alpinimonas psychrophila]